MAAQLDIVAKLRAESTQFVTGMKSADFAATNLTKSMGGLSTSIAVGAAAAVAVGAVAMYKLGASFHDAYKQIRVGTGATGEALKGLEDSFKAVYAKTPASMKDVGLAIADLNTKLGLTGPTLESSALQFIKLSRITGTDLKGNIESVTMVFKNFGVAAEDQKSSLDLLYRTSQSSGVSVAELASTMASSGVTLRALGLDFAASAAMVGTFARSGLEAKDVMPGLQFALKYAAKEGKNSATVFQETFTTISQAKSVTDVAGLAIEVFGGRAGPKLAAAIVEGKLSYQDYLDVIKNGTDTISKSSSDVSTFGGKLAMFGHQLQVALEPLATMVFQALNSAMKVLAPVLVGVADAVGVLVRGFLALPAPIKLIVPVLTAATLAFKGLLALKALALAFGTNVIGVFTQLASSIGGWTAQFMASMGMAESAALSAGYGIQAALGPIAIALAAAFVAWSMWNKGQEEAAAKQKAFTDSLDKQTGAWTENTTEISRNRLEKEGNFKKLAESGVTMAMWQKAVEGGTRAMMSQTEQAKAWRQIALDVDLQNQAKAAKEAQAAGDDLSYSQKYAIDNQNKYSESAKKARDALLATGNAADAFIAILAATGDYDVQGEVLTQLRSEADAYQKKHDVLKAVGIAQGMATGLSKEAATAAFEETNANLAAADSIKKKHDEMKAATDPLFANMKAMTEMRQAQLDYDAVVNDSTKTDAEKRAAYDRLIEATGAYADTLSDLKTGLLKGTVTADQVRARLQELVRLGIDPNSQAFRDLAARVDYAQGSLDGIKGVSLTAVAALETMKRDGLDPSSEAARGLQKSMMDAGFIAYLLNGTVVSVKFDLSSDAFWQDARAISAWLKTLDPSVAHDLADQIAQNAIYGQPLWAGVRAAGGPVAGGTPYLVGEKGPEVFVPNVSGSIIPNDAMGRIAAGGGATFGGGGNSYSIVVNVGPTSDKAAVGQATVEAIREYERRSSAAWRGA